MTEGTNDSKESVVKDARAHAESDASGKADDQGASSGSGFSGSKRGSGGSRGLPYDYQGQTPEIGVILALRHEKFANKVVFSVFIEKVKTYVLTKFDYASDMITILEKLTDPTADIKKEQPADMKEKESKSEVQRWVKQEEVKQFVKRLTALEQNQETLYGLIWGQCSSGLQEVLKTHDKYTKKSTAFDCIWILEKTKLISAGVDQRANKHSTLVRALTSLCNIRQGVNESNDSFCKRIDAYALTLTLAGGGHVMCSPELVVATDKDKVTEEEKAVEEDKFKTMLMILRSDPTRYGRLQESLFEGVYKGRDKFPPTVTGAYDLLQHIASDVSSYTRPEQRHNARFSRFRRGNRVGNVSFFQRRGNSTQEPVAGTDGRVHPHITCHGCGSKGHYRDKCPNVTSGKPRNTQVTLAHFTLTQKKLELIDRNWLLLDTGSTISVCCNPDLVTNIQQCVPGKGVTVVTNGGSQTFEEVADLKVLPIKVHFNPASIANILSLTDVANLPGARVTMDTERERAIVLHFDGSDFKFKECHDGLYFLDTSITSNLNHNNAITNYLSCLLQTVQQNKSVFTKNEISNADKARKIQEIIGWPSDTTFKSIIANNQLNNCPITVDDVTRAHTIYGPAVPLLQGKMARKKSQKPNTTYTPIPASIVTQHPSLQLYIDFFYVNGLPFLHTKTNIVNFITVQSGHTRSFQSIIKGLDIVFNLYQQRGFTITNVHADNEFDIPRLHTHLRPSVLQIYGREEHVGVIERSTRTIKE